MYRSIFQTKAELAEALNGMTVDGFQKAVDLPHHSVMVKGLQKRTYVSKAALTHYVFIRTAASTNELSTTAVKKLLEQRINLKAHAEQWDAKVEEFVQNLHLDPYIEATPIAVLKLIVRSTHLLPSILPGDKERFYAPSVDWNPYFLEILGLIDDIEYDLELVRTRLNFKSQMSDLGLFEVLRGIRDKCDVQLQAVKRRAIEYNVYNVSRIIMKVHPMNLQHLLADVLTVKGYVNIMPRDGSGDSGIDLSAQKMDEFGTLRPYIAQCKARQSKIGSTEIHQFALQCHEHDANGIYVSVGGFTRNAEAGMYAATKGLDSSADAIRKIAEITLVDLATLTRWVMECNIGRTDNNSLDYTYWLRMQTPLFGRKRPS